GVYDLTLKMLKTDPNLASYKKVFEAMYPSYSTLIPGSFSGKVVGNTYVNDRAGIKFYIPSGFVITKDSWVASNLGTYTKAKGGVIMVKPLFSNDLTDDITNPMIEITNSQMPLSSSVPTIEDGFRQIDSIVRSNSIPGFQVESGTVPSTKFNVDATGHVDYPYLGYRVSLKTTASHMNVIYTGSYDIIFHFGQNLLDNLPQFDEIYKDINLIRTSLQVY
ncbi:TPA: hypothetical protein DCQ44_02800, partial [Candidatus Taylorbacteria bacterium]|nr:hypothetical protein [Candidatus Taylorbacteria bacterium]